METTQLLLLILVCVAIGFVLMKYNKRNPIDSYEEYLMDKPTKSPREIEAERSSAELQAINNSRPDRIKKNEQRIYELSL